MRNPERARPARSYPSPGVVDTAGEGGANRSTKKDPSNPSDLFHPITMPKSTTPPLKLDRHEGETDIEYNLRLAAEFIDAYAKEKQLIHPDFDEEEPSTGEELAIGLREIAVTLADDRITRGRPVSVVGTLLPPGGTGPRPARTFTTRERELSMCDSLPFYKACQLHLTPSHR